MCHRLDHTFADDHPVFSLSFSLGKSDSVRRNFLASESMTLCGMSEKEHVALGEKGGVLQPPTTAAI